VGVALRHTKSAFAKSLSRNLDPCASESLWPDLVTQKFYIQIRLGLFEGYFVGGYLGYYVSRGTGKGKMNSIFYEARNVSFAVTHMSMFIPGLTAQSAIQHLLEHVMQHEFFHLVFESTIFRAADVNGRNAGRSLNRYGSRTQVVGKGGISILRLEESAANARAVHSHSITMKPKQREGFLRWLRTGGVGYGEFDEVLDETGVTPTCIEQLVQLVYGKDAPSSAYQLYLEEEASLQPMFSDISLLITPVDFEENDYAPYSFPVGKNKNYPDRFYEITWDWVEEHYQSNLKGLSNPEVAAHIDSIRDTETEPDGVRHGSVIVHSLPKCDKKALLMDDESRPGWICLNIFDDSEIDGILSELD
jgi:hypothetical protein